MLERYSAGDANVFIHARSQGGSTADVLNRPADDYTRTLLAAVPRIQGAR